VAKNNKNVPDKAATNKYTRRDFLTVGGTVLAGSALAVYSPTKTEPKEDEYPLSTRYLVYDSKHCAGCYSCMIACSLVHEGEVNLSLEDLGMKHVADLLQSKNRLEAA